MYQSADVSDPIGRWDQWQRQTQRSTFQALGNQVLYGNGLYVVDRVLAPTTPTGGPLPDDGTQPLLDPPPELPDGSAGPPAEGASSVMGDKPSVLFEP
jgi:hypothetical protein